MTRRVGFACKYLHEDQTQKKKILEELQRPLTERSTTAAWLQSQWQRLKQQNASQNTLAADGRGQGGEHE